MSAARSARPAAATREKYRGHPAPGFSAAWASSGEWEKPYLTMKLEYEALIAEAFVKFLEKGYVYRGPEAGLLVHPLQDGAGRSRSRIRGPQQPSIWVRFRAADRSGAIDPALAGRKVYGLIWTTTPWTLPANMAVAFHPEFEYVAVGAANGEVYIVAKDAARSRRWTRLGSKRTERPRAFPGGELERVEFQHPFLERRVLGVLARLRHRGTGHGRVHTAPGHGREDYETGSKYGIETYCPVDDAGRFSAKGCRSTMGKTSLRGQRADHRTAEVARGAGGRAGKTRRTPIRTAGAATSRSSSAPPSSGSSAWTTINLRQRALEEIKKVKWMPAWGEERISNMIADAPGLVHLAPARLGRAHHGVLLRELRQAADRSAGIRRKLARRDRAVPQRRRRRLVHASGRRAAPAGHQVPAAAAAANFRKETDILDVWFDSGSSHLAVLGRTARTCPGRPTSTSKAATSIAAGSTVRCWWAWARTGPRPTATVLTHGWVLDAAGPRHVQVARQRHRADGDHQDARRGIAAPVGGLGGVQRGRRASPKRC